MAGRWLALVTATALGSAGCAPPEPPEPPAPPAPPAVPAPERLLDATLVSSQAGDSVLVVASTFVRGTSRRRGLSIPDRAYIYLRRHSLENGALLASVEFSTISYFERFRIRPWTCEPALPGRVWCIDSFTKGVKVLDADSLQTIAEQSEILGNTPELAGTEPFYEMRVDPRTRGFVFESRDGYAWIIDPTTLVPGRFAASIRSVPKCAPDSVLQADWHPPAMEGYWYFFNSETRTTLERSAPDKDEHTPMHPEHTYLHGHFLTSLRWEVPECKLVPIVLDDPPRLLVVEEGVDHGPTLWSVFADGTTQWKVTDLPGDLVDAKLYRDRVVLVTKTKLIALRVEDGAVAWTSDP